MGNLAQDDPLQTGERRQRRRVDLGRLLQGLVQDRGDVRVLVAAGVGLGQPAGEQVAEQHRPLGVALAELDQGRGGVARVEGELGEAALHLVDRRLDRGARASGRPGR
ncbi:hypothetical protein ACVU7I_09215 [Patulibacter sp. S7RM1-6]